METNIMTYSKKVESLRKKNYTVQPIKRKGVWVAENHDSSFMNEGSKRGYVVPVRQGNVLLDPLNLKNMKIPGSDEYRKDWIEVYFTSEDRELFAQELGLENANQLNAQAKKNFWRNNTVFVDRNGLHLNLEDTTDFVRFLILNSDIENIAPNWSCRFDKGTYKFALVEKGEELEDEVSSLEDKKNAYNLLNKIDKSVQKMTDFLYVYYLQKKDAKRPPQTANADWLKKEIGRIIEDDLSTFLQILNDDDYNLKLLIQKSVESGALHRKRHQYYIPGDDSPVGTVEDMIAFLEDPKNQDVRMKLANQIEISDKK